MSKRRNARTVSIGAVSIGGNSPVAIQSMTNTLTSDTKATLTQITALEDAGCEIVRCAVPDEESIGPFSEICKKAPLPVIADIHFRADLAVKAIEAGADKIRINPGNIGGEKKLKTVLESAASNGIPVRIGVNSGSLEKDILQKHGRPDEHALAESMERYIGFCERAGFTDLVLSIKSTSLAETIEANRLIARQCEYPIHIGITEAGTPQYGTVKSAIGLGTLLLDGIGDTLRVSLSGDPVREIKAAKQILQASGARRFGPEIITCPTCARTRMKVETIAREVEKKVSNLKAEITIAVMGCEVNGPGEAAEADIGIACGKKEAVLFAKGEKVKTIPRDSLLEDFLQEIQQRFGQE